MTLFLENWFNSEMSLKIHPSQVGIVTSSSNYRKLLPIVGILGYLEISPYLFPIVLETTVFVPQKYLRLPTANVNTPSMHLELLNILLDPLKLWKGSFCNLSASLDAVICFATMVKNSKFSSGQAGRHECGAVLTKQKIHNRIKGLSAHIDDAYGTHCARAKICQYTGSAHLSAAALLVCVPFSGTCHSRAETQQTHFQLLRCIAFQSQG